MTAICPVCGKEFTPPAKHHGGRPATYCSLRCRNIKNCRAYQERLRAAGKTRPSRAKVRETRACAFCGKVFVPKQYSTKYCSKKCYNADYYRRRRETLRAKERAYRATHPRPGHHAAAKPAATPTTAPTADQSYEASLARVRAYLKLPARARWANRGMLTDAELRMAEQMWQNGHGGWEVRYNTILH